MDDQDFDGFGIFGIAFQIFIFLCISPARYFFDILKLRRLFDPQYANSERRYSLFEHVLFSAFIFIFLYVAWDFLSPHFAVDETGIILAPSSEAP